YMKLLWNPDQDVDELLDEWYERAVGKEAAPFLKEYYDLWENFWTERIKDTHWFNDWKEDTYLRFKDASYLNEVTQNDIEESRDLIESVVDNAETSLQKKRANILMRSFEYYEASALSYP